MYNVSPRILNDILPWKCEDLGNYNNITCNQWLIDGKIYYRLCMPFGWSETYPSGFIYCQLETIKNLFPCIVEDLKEVFNIPRRGLHRITLDNTEYFMFYVPTTINGEIIWETPVKYLPKSHYLRQNPYFCHRMREAIIFSDILALTRTNESNICVRRSHTGESFPVSYNEYNTTVSKGDNFSVILKTLFNKWFDENTNIPKIVHKLANKPDNLLQYTYDLQCKVDDIIKKYDKEFIWYGHFVVERISKQLLQL